MKFHRLKKFSYNFSQVKVLGENFEKFYQKNEQFFFFRNSIDNDVEICKKFNPSK